MVYGWLNRLQSLLYTPFCVLCGRHSHSHRELCAACARDLSWNWHFSSVCAAPMLPESRIRRCGQCLRSLPPWELAVSPLLYAWPLDQLLQRFKFNGDLAIGRLFGEPLADYLAAGCIMKPDLLIPIPLHNARLRQRGFNQALELARPVARRLRLRIAHHNLCVRSKDTAVQSELDAVERRCNLHAAFAIQQSLTGAHVAVLDDVPTTGATASALTLALRQAGAASVQVWRVPHASPDDR
ncbi:MAG: ComF family protein [Gammaproteobacteria bacterium]